MTGLVCQYWSSISSSFFEAFNGYDRSETYHSATFCSLKCSLKGTILIE